MKLIVCIDKNNGILFNGRRQSQDVIVRNKILELVGNYKLVMSSYSAELFGDNPNLVVTDECLSVAGEDDYYFAETEINNIDNVNEVVLINWNRNYPFDVTFNFDLKSEGFKKVLSENFNGNSHDKITMTIYRR